jgi:hypothetical protein
VATGNAESTDEIAVSGCTVSSTSWTAFAAASMTVQRRKVIGSGQPGRS